MRMISKRTEILLADLHFTTLNMKTPIPQYDFLFVAIVTMAIHCTFPR